MNAISGHPMGLALPKKGQRPVHSGDVFNGSQWIGSQSCQSQGAVSGRFDQARCVFVALRVQCRQIHKIHKVYQDYLKLHVGQLVVNCLGVSHYLQQSGKGSRDVGLQPSSTAPTGQGTQSIDHRCSILYFPG